MERITWRPDYNLYIFEESRNRCRCLDLFRNEYIFELERVMAIEGPQFGHATYLYLRKEVDEFVKLALRQIQPKSKFEAIMAMLPKSYNLSAVSPTRGIGCSGSAICVPGSESRWTLCRRFPDSPIVSVVKTGPAEMIISKKGNASGSENECYRVTILAPQQAISREIQVRI